jgi:hypothetical protein
MHVRGYAIPGLDRSAAFCRLLSVQLTGDHYQQELQKSCRRSHLTPIWLSFQQYQPRTARRNN